MTVQVTALPADRGLAALSQRTTRFEHDLSRAVAALPPVGAPDRERSGRVLLSGVYAAADQLHEGAAQLGKQLGLFKVLDGDEPVTDAARGALAVLLPAWNAPRTVAQRTAIGAHSHAETTHSSSPGSDRGRAAWEQARQGANLPNARLHGPVDAATAANVVSRLANVPAETIALTDALGRRGVAFDGRLTDVHGFKSLRGKQPRGWPPGSTWDTVPGAGGVMGYAAKASSEDPGRDHGATSLALHEYGHVVDWAIGAPGERRASESKAWRDGAWAEVRRRSAPGSYLKYHSEEWFAESFARFTKSRWSMASLARWYPDTYEYMRSHVGEPQFGDDGR